MEEAGESLHGRESVPIGLPGLLEGQGALLRAGFDEGVAAYGRLPLSREVFGACAVERTLRRLRRLPAPVTPARVGEALSLAALPDLYLAIACEEGVPGAWEAFSPRFHRTLVALALRRGAGAGEAEDLARTIPGDLFAAPPAGGARTRLGTYDGSGSLAAWLGVMVGRRLADRRRAAGPASGPGEAARTGAGDGADSVAGPGADPAAAAADRETARLFAGALRDAWSALGDREALALRFLYREGLPQKDVARLLGVGEPRASRILRGAEEKIRNAVARRLPAGSAIPADPDFLWRLLRDAVADQVASPGGTADPCQDEEPNHG